ncbi:F0F1 ATP synthase subunit epsilon [Acuticoccus yangtzensis]|uniref:F0F1 ATP synthase subunit epsilon n=1 Tax=Acuticoccus yangtzensis TaxID=1443441 RepID=UPI0009499E30|nr:F0F1 ATP synthase subunit epsilon [Acuticoccus yangtzensis]ORE93441.1 ATP synthase F1 subunit epsilon [Stappia sp. 22II-S9-Z10]
MATFPFEIVSPERLLFSGEVEAVKLPGAEGEFQVMAGHAPLLALLGPGVMEVTGGESKGEKLFIDGGFCDMNGVTCTVLAEAATPLDQLSSDDMKAMIDAAHKGAEDLEPADHDEAMRRVAVLHMVHSQL